MKCPSTNLDEPKTFQHNKDRNLRFVPPSTKKSLKFFCRLSVINSTHLFNDTFFEKVPSMQEKTSIPSKKFLITVINCSCVLNVFNITRTDFSKIQKFSQNFP